MRTLVAVAPFESVTRRPILREPCLSFVVDTTPPERSNLPSLLRSHSCLASGPSGSPEVDANVTSLPSTGLAGETVKAACGGALTGIVPVAMPNPPPVSVTLTATGCGPGVAKEVTIDAPAPSSVKSAIGE